MMSAKDKMMAKANQLKAEKEAREVKADTAAKASLVEFHGNEVAPEVVDFFKVNAGVGVDNLTGALPQLKVTELLSKNELENGERAKAGEFYYAPTQEAFKELEVSIMTISRGFYAMDKGKKPEPRWTQLIGGMIVDSMKPFIMFLSKSRLNEMWEFGKEIRPLTRDKKAPVPMFSLLVKLSLEKKENDENQEYHIVKFDLVKEKGNVKIITDLEFLSLIRNGVDSAEEMIESFIEKKAVDKRSGLLIRGGLDQAARVEVEVEEPPKKDPIPF